MRRHIIRISLLMLLGVQVALLVMCILRAGWLAIPAVALLAGILLLLPLVTFGVLCLTSRTFATSAGWMLIPYTICAVFIVSLEVALNDPVVHRIAPIFGMLGAAVFLIVRLRADVQEATSGAKELFSALKKLPSETKEAMREGDE